jgi:hypothetical protein
MTPDELGNLTKSELVQLANKYTVYYTTKSGQGSTGNYDSLSKTELIFLLKNDRDYQNEMRRLSRLEVLKKTLSKTSKDPEIIMNVILDVFQDTISEPIPGRYFTYRYNAKTPRLRYDQHPLIACLGVYEWGFRGLNFHLSKERNYTLPELGSNICLVQNDEIAYLKTIRYEKILFNS